MLKTQPTLPFEVKVADVWGEAAQQAANEQGLFDNWVDNIKRKARDNVNNQWERLRIEWHKRYSIPKYPRFEMYSPEEAVLEAWELFYLENPNDLALKGIVKKEDPNTGYTYYQTGDELLDSLERSFGAGDVPDLAAAFSHIGPAKDIWRADVFMDDRGQPFVPQKGMEGVQINENGEKITKSGQKIECTDFTSSDWLKDAMQEDPVLAKMAAKMGMSSDA